MKKQTLTGKILTVGLVAIMVSMCVPPEGALDEETNREKARLDSLRELRCPRLMSSAAEYYHNQDWESTARIYGQVVDLGCDKWDSTIAPAKEIYLFYAIAYEYLGKFDSSEYVLLRGLEKMPNNIDLHKRLAYAYKKQGEKEKEIVEMEKIMAMDSTDVMVMNDLQEIYKNQGNYQEQIRVLKNWLEVEPGNEIAQSELANAYEKTGQDPLQLFIDRFNKNPDNTSYGLDLVDRFVDNNKLEDAVDVLNRLILVDNSSKLVYRKLGEVYNSMNDLEASSKAYEELFKLDPRDYRVAITISNVNIDQGNYGKAMRWADKAIQVSRNEGEAIGQKGQVYYKAFQNCRTTSVTNDDRVVASLAYKYFNEAEAKGFTRYSGNRKWLEENEVLFAKAHWFMLDTRIKRQGYIQPDSECYSWVDEKLPKDPSW